MNKETETKIILNEIRKNQYTKNIIQIVWNRDKETKKVLNYDFKLCFDNEFETVESTKNYDVMKNVIKSLKNFEIRHLENFF